MTEPSSSPSSRTLLSVFARYPSLALVTIVVMTAISSIGYYDPYLIIARPVDQDGPIALPNVATEKSDRSTRSEARQRAEAAAARRD